MELIKKFQYSLVLFVISFVIFISGFLPVSAKLFHRYLLAPDDYISTEATVIQVEPWTNAAGRDQYDVILRYEAEDPATNQVKFYEDTLDSHNNSYDLGISLWVIYTKDDPNLVTQSWSQWQTFLITGAFTVMGTLTGLMMMHDPSPVYRHRVPRTLRERLEKY